MYAYFVGVVRSSEVCHRLFSVRFSFYYVEMRRGEAQMKTNDSEFMEQVRGFYEEQSDRSIRAVAKEFNLSRTKVRKILITLGSIESEITEEALALKELGMDICEIADELELSIATISTYLPYDTVIYKGEERSPGAIRNERYRERNKMVAEKQIQRNEKERKGWVEEVKRTESKVLKLRMELNIENADIPVLKKYGKVKEGIVREVLAPADITLHALHYVIQKAFGWQNGHLHHFSLPENVFFNLTSNNFLKWAEYCGIYFRFPSDDFEDIYWDDDYNENKSVKSWLREKYTGPYWYYGISEHFMEARTKVKKLIEENKEMRVSVPFTEWMDMSEAERRKPRIKKISDITCDEMQYYFAGAGGLEELLERLKVTEVLGEKASSGELKGLINDANERFSKNDMEAESEREYYEKMFELNGTALPLSKELIYEYDYGDGWVVKITLEDEYFSDGEIVDDELRDQIAMVISKARPVCIMADGLPVLDDVGGIYGYCEMLLGIHGEGSEFFDYDDPEETKEWARMQGWTGRMSKPEYVL